MGVFVSHKSGGWESSLRQRRSAYRWLALAAFILTLCSCGGSSGKSGHQKTATTVQVSYVSDNILNLASATQVRCVIGLPLQLKATESYNDGSKLDITASATWSSSATAVATISSQGTSSCLQDGEFNATVAAPPDCTSTCTVIPLNGIQVKPSFALSLSITAPFSSVEVGAAMVLSAHESEITAAGQTSVDITSSVAWSSLTGQLAVVTASGHVVGIAVGSASIKAASSDPTLSPAIINLSVVASTASALTVGGLNSGQLVAPGTTISVTLSVPPGYSEPVLFVPFGDTLPASGTPPAITLTIPTNVIGATALIPGALNPENYFAIGTPLALDIEPSSLPQLSVTPTSLNSQYVGDQQHIKISTRSGPYAGLVLNGSSLISYQVADPTVASVDPNGIVTSLIPGLTMISVISGNQSIDLPVTVPVLVKGDFDGNGVVDQSDVNILSLFVGTTATTKGDARDLNGDGKIDALDIAIEKGLCGPLCQ